MSPSSSSIAFGRIGRFGPSERASSSPRYFVAASNAASTSALIAGNAAISAAVAPFRFAAPAPVELGLIGGVGMLEAPVDAGMLDPPVGAVACTSAPRCGSGSTGALLR